MGEIGEYAMQRFLKALVTMRHQMLYEVGIAGFCDDIVKMGINDETGLCELFEDSADVSYLNRFEPDDEKLLLI